MMNTLQKIILVITVLAGPLGVFGVFSTGTAQAGPFDASKKDACKGANLSGNGNCDGGAGQIENVISFAVNLLTIIVGIAAVIMIIINGLKFITSNGDSNAISSARSGIIYALVGLVIVALAQVIVRFVITRLD